MVGWFKKGKLASTPGADEPEDVFEAMQEARKRHMDSIKGLRAAELRQERDNTLCRQVIGDVLGRIEGSRTKGTQGHE